MSQKFIFKTAIKWTEDKKGRVDTAGKPTIEVSTPPEFRGHSGYWSPEDLFLASINSCIMTTFLYFAEKASLSFVSYESESEGEVTFHEGKLVFSEVTVRPHIRVKSDSEKEKAEELIEKSEDYCLISSSLKVKVTLLPEIEII